jgi:hypothetical protein
MAALVSEMSACALFSHKGSIRAVSKWSRIASASDANRAPSASPRESCPSVNVESFCVFLPSPPAKRALPGQPPMLNRPIELLRPIASVRAPLDSLTRAPQHRRQIAPDMQQRRLNCSAAAFNRTLRPPESRRIICWAAPLISRG